MREMLRYRPRLLPAFVGILALLALVVPAVAAAAAPTKTVRYHGYRLVVPAAWPVYDLASDPTVCVRFNRHAVYLGRPSSRQACPAHAVGRTEAILVAPLTANAARAGAGAANPGLPPVRGRDTQPPHGSSTELPIPSAGVLVTATWGGDPAVVKRALGVHTFTARQPPPAAHPSRAKPHAIHRAGDPVYTGLGFDACATPSAAAMSAWAASPYRAVGVYVGGANEACAQPNLTASWVQQESAAGWVLLPVYVGLQAPSNGCGCAAIVPSQASAEGVAAADDAVNQAEAVGITPGNPIYDDMENYRRGGTNTASVLAFLAAWTSELHARGYASGVYSSASSGVADLVAQVGTGYLEPDQIWNAEWNNQATTSSAYIPAADWPNHQRLHQYQGGHNATYGGVTINIDGDYVDAGAASGSALFPDGTFVQVSGTPYFFEIVGGAPMFVSDWSTVGGAQAYTVITEQQYEALNPVPVNGTFVETNTGAVYRIAGGAPMYLSDPTPFGAIVPLHVDEWNIDNVGNPMSHLNPVPSDGTFVTTVTGSTYRVAGGALFSVTRWSVFGGVQSSVVIDPWDVQEIFNPLAHLAYVPVNGTVVEGLPSQAYWRFTTGQRKLTSPTAAAVRVDDRSLGAYPAVPCTVPRLTHMTLAQVKRALLAADCHLGKVHKHLVTKRRHVLRVVKQVPRARTKHVAFYTVGITLG
jgi:glycoside hydrolase-like protein